MGYRVSLVPRTRDASHSSYVAALSLDAVLAAVPGLACQRAPEMAEGEPKLNLYRTCIDAPNGSGGQRWDRVANGICNLQILNVQKVPKVPECPNALANFVLQIGRAHV